MAKVPSDADLVAAVDKFLAKTAADGGVGGITMKMVRRELQEQFGDGVSERKAFIKETVLNWLAAKENESDSDDDSDGGGEDGEENGGNDDDDDDDNDDDNDDDGGGGGSESEANAGAGGGAVKTKKKRTGYMRELAVSEALAPLFGVDTISRSAATKRLWAILKSRNLQKNKRGAYMLDAELTSIFGRKTLAFKTLSKALGKHLFDTRYSNRGSGWADDDGGDTAAEPKAKPSSTSKKRKSTKQKASTKPKKKARKSGGGGGLTKPLPLSSELSEFMGGAEQASRTEVVKALWAHIREHNLQREGDKRTIECDDTLHSLLGPETVTMFTMNKLIGRHFVATEGDVAPDFDMSAYKADLKEAAARKASGKGKRQKKGSGSGSGSGGGGLQKPMKLSKAMSEFVGGATELPRTGVVKALWAYIKENDLQNPEDKRTIVCDDTLRSLLGQDEVTMFTMNKYIGQHFVK